MLPLLKDSLGGPRGSTQPRHSQVRLKQVHLAWSPLLARLPGVCHSHLADGLQVHLVQLHLPDGSQQLLLVLWVRDTDLAGGQEQLNDLTCSSGTV